MNWVQSAQTVQRTCGQRTVAKIIAAKERSNWARQGRETKKKHFSEADIRWAPCGRCRASWGSPIGGVAGRSSSTVHVHDLIMIWRWWCWLGKFIVCHDNGKFLLLYAIMMIVVVMSMVRLFYYLATEGGELSSATATCVPSVHTQVSQIKDHDSGDKLSSSSLQQCKWLSCCSQPTMMAADKVSLVWVLSQLFHFFNFSFPGGWWQGWWCWQWQLRWQGCTSIQFLKRPISWSRASDLAFSIWAKLSCYSYSDQKRFLTPGLGISQRWRWWQQGRRQALVSQVWGSLRTCGHLHYQYKVGWMKSYHRFCTTWIVKGSLSVKPALISLLCSLRQTRGSRWRTWSRQSRWLPHLTLHYIDFCLFVRVSRVSMQGESHLPTLRRSTSTSTTTSSVKNLPRRLWQWLCTTITRGSTTTYLSTKRWTRWRKLVCHIVTKAAYAGSTRNGRADKRKVPSYAQVGM